MQIIKMFFVALEVLLLFNLLIFVHELGHFLAAQWRGLKIDRFAIWFGKPLWKKKINGVEYILGSIPAGGYVMLPQMAPMDIIEGKTDPAAAAPLPNISALDKTIVAFAGPLFSFMLAFSFAVLVWMVGRPTNNAGNTTTIGWVDPTGPAWKAGLRPGDKIVAIDRHKVTSFSPPSRDSVTWRIVTSENSDISVDYLRDGKEETAHVMPTRLSTKWYERKSLRKILIGPSYPAIIADIATNSPAALAGLEKGDEVIKFNGEPIYAADAIMAAEGALTNSPARSATFTVRRGTNVFDKTLLAEKPIEPAGSNPSYGILGWFLNNNEALEYPTPLSQIQESAGQIFATISAVASRKSEIGVQQLGGPVMIIRLYSNLFASENGWRRVLWFSVLFNVNLAMLNLLPFPVLDGGHIALALLEAVRRRPVSAKLLNMVQTACAMLLIGFMLFVTFYDAGDWFRSARKDRDQPVVFAPKK